MSRRSPTSTERKVLVFLGRLFGQTSPVPMYSALVGAEVILAAGQWLDVPLDAGHEHGFLCDTGGLAVGGAVARPGEIVFRPAGWQSMTRALILPRWCTGGAGSPGRSGRTGSTRRSG
jgi:redox-sensitive bicupin YhaK (pirin superfamily)